MSDELNYIPDRLSHREWPSLRETTLADIERRVSELDSHSSNDDVLTWLDRVSAFVAACHQLRAAMYAVACEWIAQNGDLRVNDDIAFTLGHQKIVKCRDVRLTLHTVLNAVGGDIDATAALLATDSWKHGACRGVLTVADFERCFDVLVRSKLVNGNSVPRRLVRIDRRFINQRGTP